MNIDKFKRISINTVLRIVLIFFTVIFVYPFVWNLLCSFMTNTEYLTNPYALPAGINYQNYINAFEKANMGAYFVNSVLVVILSVAILLIFVIPAAYVLARYKFKFNKAITTLYMACVFLQPTYIMIPLFLEVQSINGLNNRLVLSLVYAVMQFPFAIFTLHGFISALPTGYEEAARIDGGTNLNILLKVVVPLCKPGVVTITMLTAMGFWSEYPLALVLMTDESRKTLPIGLANLFEVQKYATDWGAMFAGLIIVLVPTVIIYLIGQKQLLQGITVGGLKG